MQVKCFVANFLFLQQIIFLLLYILFCFTVMHAAQHCLASLGLTKTFSQNLAALKKMIPRVVKYTNYVAQITCCQTVRGEAPPYFLTVLSLLWTQP